jgi:hypothetical protein
MAGAPRACPFLRFGIPVFEGAFRHGGPKEKNIAVAAEHAPVAPQAGDAEP